MIIENKIKSSHLYNIIIFFINKFSSKSQIYIQNVNWFLIYSILFVYRAFVNKIPKSLCVCRWEKWLKFNSIQQLKYALLFFLIFLWCFYFVKLYSLSLSLSLSSSLKIKTFYCFKALYFFHMSCFLSKDLTPFQEEYYFIRI